MCVFAHDLATRERLTSVTAAIADDASYMPLYTTRERQIHTLVFVFFFLFLATRAIKAKRNHLIHFIFYHFNEQETIKDKIDTIGMVKCGERAYTNTHTHRNLQLPPVKNETTLEARRS